MPTRTMDETMDAFGTMLDVFDGALRAAHSRYRSYDPAILVEHDIRAQTACTYSHAIAEADRAFMEYPNVRPIDVRGLKIWLLEDYNVALRIKKMDEDGSTRNYPTKQAKDYDAGRELPGLPMPPVRLTAGYLLDDLNVNYVRTQIARPAGKRSVMWCAAVVPLERRVAGERPWVAVTRGIAF